jgi:hypothetical protein
MTEPSSQGCKINHGGKIEPSSQVNTNNGQQQEQQKEEEIIILPLASGEKSRIRIALEPLVPINSPAPWVAINLACCLGSCFLIHQVLHTTGPVERRYGTELYIAWNVVTTFFWVIEVGLIVWFDPVMSSWIHRIELVIAFYFMADSIDMLLKWGEPDEDIKAELIDVTICALAYFFELTVTIRALLLRRAEQEKDICVVDDDPSKTAITTDYTILGVTIRAYRQRKAEQKQDAGVVNDDPSKTAITTDYTIFKQGDELV